MPRFDSRQKARGFTLLEVMVALTITGLALGALLSVVAGSKRLAFSAQQALAHSVAVRSLINSAQLRDERGELILDLGNRDLQLVDNAELDIPERQTQASTQALRGYRVVEDGEVLVSGTYWVELDLPE
ncbi:MAG: type II secretion system GspH family protein [Pseudomonadales bacterium]|nr:type II secretion system GspH family protein [Pseudomonadales bacterium]